MKTITVLFSVLFVLLAAGVPQATEYHVWPTSPGASDDGPGTAGKPWKTLAKAAAGVQAGDTVLIHAGVYPEAVTVSNAGTGPRPIGFKAFGDDEVILEGADAVDPVNWRPAPGTKNVYGLTLPRDPGQLFVDGKAVYPKVVQTHKDYPRAYRLGALTDRDKNVYQYDAKAKRLLLTLGGDSPARHDVRVPVRTTAFILGDHCRLAGIHARNYVYTAIYAGGCQSVVEDCLVTDCGGGIVVGGWDNEGVIVRRNTVIGALGCGIFLPGPPHALLHRGQPRRPLHPQPGPRRRLDRQHQDELRQRHDFRPQRGAGGRQPRHRRRPRRLGAVGRHQHRPHRLRGQHVAPTTRRPASTSSTPWATRGPTSTPAIATGTESPAGSRSGASSCGTSCWKAAAAAWPSGAATRPTRPPITFSPITSSAIAARRSGSPSRSRISPTTTPTGRGRTRRWPSARRPRAVRRRSMRRLPNGPRPPATTRTARSATPGRRIVGLDTVTFRVGDAKDPSQVLMMVGNGGFEFEDPVGQNLLPYFWRPGSGDGVEHKFPYAADCGLEGGCDAHGYGGAGATVAHLLDSHDAKQPKLAHGGLRCVKIDGQKPGEMCKQGLGFWSPSLPARPGDSYDISFHVRGRDLKPAGGRAIAAFVEFSDATGQHRRRAGLPAGPAAGMPLVGTFAWTRLAAAVKVPRRRQADARLPRPAARHGAVAAGRRDDQGEVTTGEKITSGLSHG